MGIKEKSVQGAKQVANLYTVKSWREHDWRWRSYLIAGTLAALTVVSMVWVSREPNRFDVKEMPALYLAEGQQSALGSYTVTTTAHLLDVLLNKPGGYLRNDILPPGLLVDNIPEWEFGVIRHARELLHSLRYDFSRSQSQSRSVKVLEDAHNAINRDASKWATIPTPEGSFEEAMQKVLNYHEEITDGDPNNAQFYARADNLVAYLEQVSKSLGDYGQVLSASVGEKVINHDGGVGEQSKMTPSERHERTPWLKIDNNFYESRGYSWALLHALQAIRIDFYSTLEKKNALASMDQIIAELEKAQGQVWAPVILNGRGFGFSANHSLVMANYLSRTNAGIIDLIRLLREG